MTQPDNRENGNRQETVVRLQQAIEALSSIVSQLNTGTAANVPSAAIESLLTSTQQIAASLVPPPEEEALDSIEDILTSAFSSETLEELEEFTPLSRENTVQESGFFAKIRSIIPSRFRESVPTWLLTGLLTGTVVAILLTAVVVIPKNFPEIAQNLPNILPQATPETIETPPELKAPDVPLPVPISKPEPKLTPEQGLVAAIQEEITALTSRYPEGLISTVEVDFLGSRLTVIVNESWYELNASQQDKFADSIFQRSQRLDFRRLEVKDTSGVLLARSPVVGDRLVIVSRTRGESAPVF